MAKTGTTKPLTMATLYALVKKLTKTKESISSNEEEVIIANDDEGALKIIEMTKDTVIKSNKQIFLHTGIGNIYEVDESKTWENTKEYFVRQITTTNMCVQRGKHICPYSKNASGVRNILSMVMPKLKDDLGTKPKKEVFASKLWESNLLKLCWTDGYYDFKDSTFKPYDDQTYSTICIKKPYPKERNEEYIKEIYEKILNKSFQNQEKLKYFLNWCARALAGHVEDKTWAMGLGNRDCGKGVYYDLFKMTFEEYIGSFLAEELLIYRISEGDAAKKCAWTIPLEFKRLSFSNEIKTQDNKGNKLKLDGNGIKKITGGGDDLTARLNYKDQITFKIQSHFLFFANDMIDVAPDDALKTVNVFDFDCEFVHEKELTEEQKQINETSNYKYYIADPEIKTKFLKRPEILDAFFFIIIDHYTPTCPDQPTCIKNNTDDLLDCSNREKELFLEMFSITKDKNDILPVREFDEIIKMIITKPKAKFLLKQLGVDSKGKQVKLSGHNTKCYIGIVRKHRCLY